MHRRNRQIVFDWETKQIRTAEDRQIRSEHDHYDRAKGFGRAKVEEREQWNDEHPGQSWGGHSTVKVTAPENTKDQILNRNQCQWIVRCAGAQQEREDPERRARGFARRGQPRSWVG